MQKADNNAWFISVTITLGAFLLFWIQPLIGKQFLPTFGGSALVWNSTMIFFQTMLFIGYGYTYLLTRNFALRRQWQLHIGFMVIAAIFVMALWKRQFHLAVGGDPVFTILTELLIRAGLPVFIVSVSAPLIQYWFSRTQHELAADPYFLYSASNIGSLLACIGFSFALEPLFGQSGQYEMWGTLFLLYIVCMVLTIRSFAPKVAPTAGDFEAEVVTIPLKEKLYIIALSFTPAGLLLAVTQTITMDISAVPLLWLLPLVVYLLTFIIAFSRKPMISFEWAYRNYPIILVFPVIMLIEPDILSAAWLIVVAHTAGLFILSYLCHTELVARRPHPSALPMFYLLLAFGGMLGGIFVGLVAPLVFNSLIEYQYLIFLAVLLQQWAHNQTEQIKRRDFYWIAVTFLALAFVALATQHTSAGELKSARWLCHFAIIVYIFINSKKPALFAGNLLALMLVFHVMVGTSSESKMLYQARNYYGVQRIYLEKKGRGVYVLRHNSTVHGAYFKDDSDIEQQALTYYRPLIDSMKIYLQHKPAQTVALVGLGVGTLTCAFRPEDSLYFYELDPDVIKLAQNSDYFRYLKRCGAAKHYWVGDARINLQDAKPKTYDAIVLDAFSSDSIPVHLLTLEAMQIYLKALRPGGVLYFHISNRYLNLQPLLFSFSNELELYIYRYKFSKKVRYAFDYPSSWIALSRKPLDLKNWEPVKHAKPVGLWHDDYVNIFPLFSSSMSQ